MTTERGNYSGDSIRSKVLPNLFATILLATISIVPILDRDLPQVIRLGVFFIWLFTTFQIGVIRKNTAGRGVLVGWIIYFCLQIVYSLTGVSREITFFLAKCYIYALPIAMVYVTRYYNRKELKVLLYSIMMVFTICLVHNFFLGSSGEEEIFEITSEDKGTNSGGTAFVSGCLFILPSLWIFLRFNKNRIIRLACAGIIVGCIYYMLVINSRTTVLVIFAFLILGMLIVELSMEKQIKPGKLLFRIVIIVALSMAVAAPLLSSLISYYGDAARMVSRLEDLSFVAQGGKIEDIGHGSLFYRYLLWQTSVNTFFESIPNFLVGIGEKEVAGDLDSLISSGVGSHSEFFDLAARYGMLGILIYISLIRKSFHYLLRLVNNPKIKNYTIVVITTVVIYSFFNITTTSACLMVMLFLVFPITLQLLKEENI